MENCLDGGARCQRLFEFIPTTASSRRLHANLARFNEAYVAGDLTLAENRALLLDQNMPAENRLTSYLLYMTQATQGYYSEARRKLFPLWTTPTYLDDVSESALWLITLLDYVIGDWIAFEQHGQQYLGLPQVGGCLCLRACRSALLQGLIALHESAYGVALDTFQRMACYQWVFPLTCDWARIGMIEARLRLGNRMMAIHEINQFDDVITQRGNKPVAGWQLFFPQVFKTSKECGHNWCTVDMPMPMTAPHQVYPETAMCKLELLGQGRILWHDREIQSFTQSGDALQLVAYLALKPEGATGQEILLDLWPERWEDGEASGLIKLIEQIAAWTPEPLILYDRGVFHARADLWVDVNAYVERYNAARGTRDIPALMEVKSLYTAPFLHGTVGVWAEEMRARFQLMQSWLQWHLSSLYRERGDFGMAQTLLEASVDSNYTFDRGMNDLMRLLEELGLRGEAIRRYETYRKRIKGVYGIEPAPHLQQLAQRLRSEETQITGAFRASDFQRVLRPTNPVLNKSSEPQRAPATSLISFPQRRD